MRIVAGIVGIASAAQPSGFVARALSSAATAPVLPHAPACACVRRITAGGCWSAPITHEQIGDSAIAKLVKVARQHVLVLLQPGGLRQRGHQLPCQGGVAPHTEQAVHVVKIVNPSPPELAVHHWCEAPHTNQTNARTQRQHTQTTHMRDQRSERFSKPNPRPKPRPKPRPNSDREKGEQRRDDGLDLE